MKQLKTKAGLTMALLLGASAAAADPIAIITTPSGVGQTTLYGSDTLNQVTDILFAAMTASGDLTQITTYGGIGSSGGERQLTGSPSTTEPTCTPTDANGGAEGNPGCQEISPMSRHMVANICEDDFTAPNTANVSAEALAICSDGLVVLTNNAAHGQYAGSLAECSSGESSNVPPTTNPLFPGGNYDEGTLRWSGDMPLPSGGTYTIGGGLLTGINAWKDVLRIIYAGCLNTENAAACGAVPRVDRGLREVRQTLVNNWAFMVRSDAGLAGEVAANVAVDCPSGNCTQLRQAYRRDDSSGTTGVFLEVLGLPANQTARTRLIGLTGSVQAVPNHIFLDGGDLEGFWPNVNPTVAGVAYGDPISRPCAAEDDLCRSNGTMGIVRAIRSSQVGGFPPVQCTRGRFARQEFLATAQAVCPDGTVPSAGRCFAPYFAVDRNGDGDNTDVEDRDFNCVNDINSRPGTVPASVDGRSYNYLWRDSDGNLEFTPGGDGILPQVAQWRQNMMNLDTVLPVPGGARPAVCLEADATRQIGCLVGNTTCTIGFAGREAVATDTFDNLQEAFLLQNRDLDAGELVAVAPSDANLVSDVGSTDASNYPFARDLFVSALGGFQNITADCTARGGSAAYCADQVNIAEEFYNMTDRARNACTASGFIPLAESRCQGAQLTAGCGAPTVQAKTECLPQ